MIDLLSNGTGSFFIQRQNCDKPKTLSYLCCFTINIILFVKLVFSTGLELCMQFHTLLLINTFFVFVLFVLFVLFFIIHFFVAQGFTLRIRG